MPASKCVGHEVLVAVSSAGGQARQIRVQYWANDDRCWRQHASFRHLQAAEVCLQSLATQGFHARLIRYGICPVAG